jgi:hypothetical protein
MTGDRITPLKSERIQLPVPTDPELEALWAGFLAALAEAHGHGHRSRPMETRSGRGSRPEGARRPRGTSPALSPAGEGPAER